MKGRTSRRKQCRLKVKKPFFNESDAKCIDLIREKNVKEDLAIK